MKLESLILFIILSIYPTKYSNEKKPYYFCNDTQNNFNKLIENINEVNEDNSYNISHALKYLAPSYFTLAIQELLPNFLKYIKNISCLNEYITELNETKIQDLIKYSSKYFPDFGDEENCLSEGHNNAFILFVIKYNIHNNKIYTGKFRLLPFISNGFSFYGLCIQNTESCTTNLINIMNITLNNFKGNLNGIDEFKVFIFSHYPNDTVKIYDLGYAFGIFIIYWLYVGFRIVIWIIGATFFREKNDKNSKKYQNEDDSSEEEEEEEEENESNRKENHENNNDLIEKNNFEKKLSKKEKYPRFYALYRFCSISKSFSTLLQKENNKYYNEKDLYFILLFRFIALLLKVLIDNLEFMFRNPSKEIDNVELFKYPVVTLIKFSSFSDIIIILSESIIVSYKLMSFLRKYTPKDEEPSFKLFLNFFLHIIPSFLSVVILFFTFYFHNELIIMILILILDIDYSTAIQHLKKNIVDCNFCVNNAKSLIPFYLHYRNFTDQNNSDESCFQFMLIMINLFYCYCLCILLIFISFKIKNKIYDIAISIVFIISFFLPHSISCQSYLKGHNYFNINLLFGENCSTTYTHLFINYYFLGILIGFALFYNNNITHENSFQNSNNYKPFYYFNDINGMIFKSPIWVHALIIIITIGIQVFLCIYFQLYSPPILESNNLEYLNDFVDFLYLNEKKIFALCFGILIGYLYIFKSESKLKTFGNNKIIITVNRLGYGFYASIESFINHIIISCRYIYSISAPNIIFSTFGFIILIIFINMIAYSLNDFPIRILCKKFLRKMILNNK